MLQHRRHILHIAALIALFGAAPATLAGDPPRKSKPVPREKPSKKPAPQRMDFKNNVLPGQLTTHEVRRATRRSRLTGKSLETFSYEQVATWTQINMADPKPATATLYQMMADGPAKVLGYFKDNMQLKSAPAAARSLLSRGSTRLESAEKSMRDSPALVPRVEGPERAILELVLDVAHWPPKRIEAGHKWERDVKAPDFTGTQTFEFVDLTKEGGETLARLTMYGSGRFSGGLEREYEFGKVQAVIHWARLDQRLERIEAQASWRRLRGDVPVEYDMKIQVKLLHAQRLAESVQERLKQQVEAINLAARETQLGHTRDAAKLLEGFVQQYPDSPWMPVIADLRAKIKAQNDAQARLSNAELLKSIGTLFLELEAANEKADDDARESAANLLSALANDYGPRLRKHAESADEQTRGLAIFALAFSAKPDDFASVEDACSDSSTRVRTLAISAIAASGRSGVRADLLLKLLEDKTAGVRARAADAVTACIRRDDLSIQSLVEALDKVMVHDDALAVRRSAIRAIEAIGGPGDIPRLEQALSHELDRDNRAAIQRAIERLRARG